MSTIAYAQLTSRRDASTPVTSTTTSPPGVKTYVDTMAALVPSEVLTLHALMLEQGTTVEGTKTTISDPQTLLVAFVGLLIVSMGLYAVPRLLAKKWDALDGFRILIPPLAFVGWTMLQRSTAFDGVLAVLKNDAILKYDLSSGLRTVAGLFLAVILGAAATMFAYSADAKKPQ